MELDAIDRKLLAAVQEDATLTADQLGAKAGLSPSAAQRRHHRLKQAGVILREAAVLSHEAVGRPFLMVVQIKVENDHEPEATDFVTRLQNAREVMQLFYVTGQSDYVMICTMRDMTEYEAFTQRLLIESPNVVSFQTSVVMSPLKMTLQVPVD